jgi:hypothetical protein
MCGPGGCCWYDDEHLGHNSCVYLTSRVIKLYVLSNMQQLVCGAVRLLV